MIGDAEYGDFLKKIYSGKKDYGHFYPKPHVSAFLEKHEKATFKRAGLKGGVLWMKGGRVGLRITDPDRPRLFLSKESGIGTDLVDLNWQDDTYLEEITVLREKYPKFDDLMSNLEMYYPKYVETHLSLQFVPHFDQEYEILVRDPQHDDYLFGRVGVNWALGPMFCMVDPWVNGVEPTKEKGKVHAMPQRMIILGMVQVMNAASVSTSEVPVTKLTIVPEKSAHLGDSYEVSFHGSKLPLVKFCPGNQKPAEFGYPVDSFTKAMEVGFGQDFGALPPADKAALEAYTGIDAKTTEMMLSAGVSPIDQDAGMYAGLLRSMSRIQVMKLFLMAFPEVNRELLNTAIGHPPKMHSVAPLGSRLLDVEGDDAQREEPEDK